MNRLKALRIVNAMIAFLVLGLVFSGLFHDLIPYAVFSKLHPLTGFTFAFLIAVHVYLNFNWIKANYLKRMK